MKTDHANLIVLVNDIEEKIAWAFKRSNYMIINSRESTSQQLQKAKTWM